MMNDNVAKLERLLSNLQDDILDEYNAGNISEKEMKNIMRWTRKIIEIKKGNPNSKFIVMGIEKEDKK